jgi:hypothetical protein
MDKQTAIKLAGGVSKLAKIFVPPLTPSAVTQWGVIPELRVFQLQKLRPKWFNRDGTVKAHLLENK